MDSINFYDTSALLPNYTKLEEQNYKKFIISSSSLKRLENLKSNKNCKKLANDTLNWLIKNTDKYDIWFYKKNYLKPFKQKGIEIDENIKDLSSAFNYDLIMRPDETIFITSNFYIYNVANLFFGEDSIIYI